MKFRIGDEEDKELSRIAFLRAKRVLNRRYLLRALLLVGIGTPFVLFAPLPFSLCMAVIWGTVAAISIPAFCRYDHIFSEEYHKQLDELKLEMRGRKEHMEMMDFNRFSKILKEEGYTNDEVIKELWDTRPIGFPTNEELLRQNCRDMLPLIQDYSNEDEEGK